MGRKKKYEVQPAVYESEDMITDDAPEFSSEVYSSISSDIEFKNASDLFDYWLHFLEPCREYTEITYKGINMLVIPLGKSPSGKYILMKKDGTKFAASAENIKI